MEIKTPNKKYRTKESKVYSCQYHCIFTPKYRRRVLTDGVDSRLKELILEKQEELSYKVLEIEVMPDHVHLLMDCDPDIGVVPIIGRIKGYTSKILREEFPWLKSRIPTLWTRSKFVSSVGSVSLDVVKRYIEDQKGV